MTGKSSAAVSSDQRSRSPIIRGRLRDARREVGLRQRELAEVLEVGINKVSRWETGSAVPSRVEVMGLCYALRKSPGWFYGESLSDHLPETDFGVSALRDRVDTLVNLIFVGAEARRVSLDDVFNLGTSGDGAPSGSRSGQDFVNLYELAAAAGSGAEAGDDDLVGHIRVDRRPFRARAVNPGNCDLILVSGDSMRPTLQDGSMVLVDRDSRELREGHVFILQGPGGLQVKRVRRDGSRWLLVSDNPDWELSVLDPDSYVIGEVRWACNSI